MATVPVPHQFAVGEEATANNVNTLYQSAAFLLNRPCFLIRQNSTTTSMVNNTDTAVVFDTADIDTDTGWSSSTNPSRYTFQTSGKWLLFGGVQFATAASAGKRQSKLRMTGSSQYSIGSTMATGTSSGALVAPTFIIKQVTAGTDYVELLGFENSGANIATDNSWGGSTMGGVWISN